MHIYSESNIYNHLLIALSAVQKGTELKDLWLDNIANDDDTRRVITSTHGLLTAYDSKEERREQIPLILQRLKQRNYDVDQTSQYSSGGFLFDENLLDNIVDHIANLCFDEGKHHYLDKELAAIDFLDGVNIRNGEYDFRFTRFTPKGKSNLAISYNLIEDEFKGDIEAEKTVREYLSYGYSLPNGIGVTSLEGRKIENGSTRIVKGENLDDSYEGIIGLSHTPFTFVLNYKTSTLLLGKPLDSICVIFGVQDNWEKRRIGLDKIKEKIEIHEFKSLSEIVERVNELIAAKKKQGYFGDSLYNLKNKLSDEITPYITTIIKERLVKRGDGLAE